MTKRNGKKNYKPKAVQSVGTGPKLPDFNWAESNRNAYCLTLQQGH